MKYHAINTFLLRSVFFFVIYLIKVQKKAYHHRRPIVEAQHTGAPCAMGNHPRTYHRNSIVYDVVIFMGFGILYYCFRFNISTLCFQHCTSARQQEKHDLVNTLCNQMCPPPFLQHILAYTLQVYWGSYTILGYYI